ncbi:MAG: ABC transporter ATP-binding protein [Clostridiales bacterium 43-6]|nr:MAG: ABC transporter ATP-binding protein [Clostridiales bacterium 43-6]
MEHEHIKCAGNCCGLCCTKIEDFGVMLGHVKIIENVNMHIHCGELTAIIGPNGAGKSTLLKAILGEYKHTGSLTYMDAKGEREGSPLIGYVPQHLDFDNGTPASVLDLFLSCNAKSPAFFRGSKKQKNRAKESLQRVNAEHLLHKRLGVLSGGELQRVLLALALDPIPDLLLLDEPVSGIDQKGLALFYKTLSDIKTQYDLTIILVSHDLALIKSHADRVMLLNKTVVCAGTPQEVFDNAKTSELFGLPVGPGKKEDSENA